MFRFYHTSFATTRRKRQKDGVAETPSRQETSKGTNGMAAVDVPSRRGTQITSRSKIRTFTFLLQISHSIIRPVHDPLQRDLPFGFHPPACCAHTLYFYHDGRIVLSCPPPPPGTMFGRVYPHTYCPANWSRTHRSGPLRCRRPSSGSL